MFDFVDIYVIGFSLLLVYVLKTYSQLRAVWQQIGSVRPRFSRETGHIMLCSSSSAIPGRRTLFTEYSHLARISKDVKYISPGLYKGWTEKHNGIRPFSGRTPNVHGCSRIQNTGSTAGMS